MREQKQYFIEYRELHVGLMEIGEYVRANDVTNYNDIPVELYVATAKERLKLKEDCKLHFWDEPIKTDSAAEKWARWEYEDLLKGIEKLKAYIKKYDTVAAATSK